MKFLPKIAYIVGGGGRGGRGAGTKGLLKKLKILGLYCKQGMKLGLLIFLQTINSLFFLILIYEKNPAKSDTPFRDSAI